MINATKTGELSRDPFSFAMKSDEIRQLLKWARNYGAEISAGLHFEFDELEGIRCICTEDVQGAEVRIPKSLIIHRGLIELVFPGVLYENDNSNTWLKLSLAKLMFDSDDSRTAELSEKFRPYLNCLPAVVDSPLVWNPRELVLLQGTNLGSSLQAKLHVIYKEWYDIVNSHDKFDKSAIASELAIYENFGDFTSDQLYDNLIIDTIRRSPKIWYSFSAFLWSHLIFLSRAFPEYVLNENSERSSVILLPVIDLLNHDFKSKVEWFPVSGGFGYKRLGTVSKGQQLYNNYGGKGNEELLSGYGFLLEENPFTSAALKIKVPLDQIPDILTNGINLPTMDDYTTYAFEKKESVNEASTADRPELAFKDGVTYLLNKSNDSPLMDMLSLFAYLSKVGDEIWNDSIPLFKGLHNLRLALDQKLNVANQRATENETLARFPVKSYRKECAKIYREEQVSILKQALAQLKSLEKKWMSENKGNLLTMKKILKHDPSFVDQELPSLFDKIDCGEIVFPDTLQFLALWMLVKLQRNSFTGKHSWVQENYKAYLSKHFTNTNNVPDEEADQFYSDMIVLNQAQDKVSPEDARRVFGFLSTNTFTRSSSKDRETILVKK